MTDYRCWVYHKDLEPKIVNKSETEALYNDGWADSPAEFLDLKANDILIENSTQAQQLGDSILGVAESLNGELNLDLMDKEELEEYAKKHLGVDIDRRKSAKNLVKEIREKLEA